MRQSILVAAILVALAGHCGETAVVDPALAPLIAKLGDENFDTREAAERGILALGEDHEELITPVLKKFATQERDAEVRNRLERLAQKIGACGAVGWSAEAGQIYQLPSIYNNRVYVGNKDGTLICYDATTGKKIWAHDNGGFIFKSVAVADGRVIFIRTRKDGRPDGRIFALDAVDGHELWSWQDDKKSQYFTAPIAANGSVYVGRDNELICLDALQGDLRWDFKTIHAIVAPPAVADNKVFIEQYGGMMHCVDAQTGKLVWDFELVARKSDVIGIDEDDRPVRSIRGGANAGACVENGNIFAAGGSTVYRLDSKTGAKVWESRGSDPVAVPMALKGNLLYAAHGQTLRCLRVEDGVELWSKHTGGHIFAAPSAIGDRVYIGSLNDKLTMYCLDAKSGAEVWTHITKEGGYAEPIVTGRRLFIGYHSKFYCLKTGMPGPIAWPMSGGNPGRTGCND